MKQNEHCAIGLLCAGLAMELEPGKALVFSLCLPVLLKPVEYVDSVLGDIWNLLLIIVGRGLLRPLCQPLYSRGVNGYNKSVLPIPMLASWAKKATSIMPTMPKLASMPTCKSLCINISAKTPTTNRNSNRLLKRCRTPLADCLITSAPTMATSLGIIYRHWSKAASMLTLPPIKVKRPTKYPWIARIANWSKQTSTTTKPITRLPVLKDRF